MNAPAVALPRFVQLEPVGECNLRCRMCPIQYRRDGRPHGPPAFMPFATFTHLLSQCEGAEELHLQGLGEPLLHPDFFRMVAHARARGLTVSTNTNLSLLTAARAELCVTSGLSVVHVSMDGATARTYESIRTGGRFDKLLRNLDRLVAARTRLHSATPRIRIVMVVMKRNLAELAAVVRTAHEHGVRSVFVQHLCHEYGEAGLPKEYLDMRSFYAAEALLGADPREVAAAFDAARSAASALGVDLRLPSIAPATGGGGQVGRCDWPWRGAYLSYRGDAMPCCMVSTPDRVSLGDTVRHGVATVWNGERYAAFRAALRSASPPEVCRSCAVYKGTF